MLINKTSKELYEEYKEIAQKAADINNASVVLGWDQEVYMPPKGFPYRGRQLATLASLAHELVTSEKYGNILKELSGRNDLEEAALDNVKLSYEDYQKEQKLPSAFVTKLTQQISASYDAWIRSRKENNFQVYATELAKMVNLKLQQADYYGYDENAYDALLDEYEKGATVSMLEPVFTQVKEELPRVLKAIQDAEQVDDSFLFSSYDKDKQWDFSVAILKQIGYDFDAGRQDLSEHPFTTSFAPEDVRVTTRVNENDFASLLWSSIHEGGHALYEQGLPKEQYGLPLGAAASLGVHESQSRLWENNVGRGIHFWKYNYSKLQSLFKEQLKDVPLESFYKGMNKVYSSLIRTESDELTYHFHVLIRYEIEKALLNKELQATDLVNAWNSLYEQYLGITHPDDKQGVLQDVHWAHGSFGYFPTYSLGSFYAAQYYEQAKNDIAGLEKQLENGNCMNLLDWLRRNIHQYGRKYRSEELCTKVTGEGLSFNAFMKYATKKYEAIYSIKIADEATANNNA